MAAPIGNRGCVSGVCLGKQYSLFSGIKQSNYDNYLYGTVNTCRRELKLSETKYTEVAARRYLGLGLISFSPTYDYYHGHGHDGGNYCQQDRPHLKLRSRLGEASSSSRPTTTWSNVSKTALNILKSNTADRPRYLHSCLNFQHHRKFCNTGPSTTTSSRPNIHSNSEKSLAPKLILGIETSCDDTGAAVVDNEGHILGEALESQTRLHIELGGIIPPIARDMHKRNIDDVVNAALREANISLQDLSAIATTVKPGLHLSLLVGLAYGKSLVQQSGKPFIPIHHMEAHALTVRIVENEENRFKPTVVFVSVAPSYRARTFYAWEQGTQQSDRIIEFPYLVLLMSGGHCLLAVVRGVEDFVLIGKGIDDAPGDALDKTARRMKLKNLPECRGLQGGQAIELLARRGDPLAFDGGHVMSQIPDCNFSFSGLKWMAKRIIIEQEKRFNMKGGDVLPNVADVCASLQYFILRHLAKRLQRGMLFCELNQLIPEHSKTLVLSGGVASNLFIRQGLQKMCNHYGYRMVCPPPKLCTDNGIMIAWNGMEKLLLGVGVAEDIDAVQAMPKCILGVDQTQEVLQCSIRLPRVKIMPGSDIL